jgi:hypothetical protein
MPNQAYILNHELWQAYQAVCLSGAGKAELATLAEYDIDPLADDAEEWVIEAIEDQCACERADNLRKEAA